MAYLMIGIFVIIFISIIDRIILKVTNAEKKDKHNINYYMQMPYNEVFITGLFILIWPITVIMYIKFVLLDVRYLKKYNTGT